MHPIHLEPDRASRGTSGAVFIQILEPAHLAQFVRLLPTMLLRPVVLLALLPLACGAVESDDLTDTSGSAGDQTGGSGTGSAAGTGPDSSGGRAGGGGAPVGAGAVATGGVIASGGVHPAGGASATGGVTDLRCDLPDPTGCEGTYSGGYYFNPTTEQCELVSFGAGCDVGFRGFRSEPECLSTCGDISRTQCPLQMPTGACTTDLSCTYDGDGGCLCVAGGFECTTLAPDCAASETATGGAASSQPLFTCGCINGVWGCFIMS